MTENEIGPSETDRMALVTWSAIAEPGDAIANALVGVLGPRKALEWFRCALTDPVEATHGLHSVVDDKLAQRALAGVERWKQRDSAWAPEPHLERAEKVGVRVIARGDSEWPNEINDLGDAAPYCLWARGPLSIREAWSRSIAIVGSRSSTAYGEHIAATLAGELADVGYVVISGGAYGIDARAHRAALAVGGFTVAVMAGGVDRLYPGGNTDLLTRMLETGAIVSELPLGYAPYRSRFLTRNRIIAAAGATIVVEAAHRSGALSTANHAAGLGRPVAAVPGPVTSASSSGCHRLIRDGAVLVSDARDVRDLVEPLDATRKDGIEASCETLDLRGSRMTFAAPEHRQAYDAIVRRGSTISEIAKGSGLSPMEARAALGGLLLAGVVVKEGVLWRRNPIHV